MTSISIIGPGKMGSAIADLSARADADIQIIRRRAGSSSSPERPDAEYGVIGDELTGELVVLAVPYASVADVLRHYSDGLSGKVVIDISNPIYCPAVEKLVVPPSSSAAAEIRKDIPDAAVVKA